MNMVMAAVIVVAVTTVSVTVMLLVRRHAPEGSYFADGDRASGVFGVLATGFSVLLGFIIFLAFTSYDSSRAGAETEALVVAQQIETAQRLPDSVSGELTGELVCYGRSVINEEWTLVESGSLDASINPWAAEMFSTLDGTEPTLASEQSAYDKWLDQTEAREAARNDRIHGAAGVLPAPLWVVLIFISIVIFAYMLFFADRSERALTQAMLMGSVVSVITLLMLLLAFLSNPFQDGLGGLRPHAMERTMRVAVDELEVAGFITELPCNEVGEPV